MNMFLQRLNWFFKRRYNFIKRKYNKVINLIGSSSYFFKNKSLKNIIKRNRKLTRNSLYWDFDNYQIGDYGVPKEIMFSMNNKMVGIPTYSDLICFLTNNFWEKGINYLEIGTSVMKNLHQVSNNLSESNILCIDLEEPPIVFNEIKNNVQNNNVEYLKSDIFHTKKIESYFNSRPEIKFDFVFSDAAHSYEGLIQEYDFIYKNRLNNEFIIYFDDLDFTNLEKAFLEIYKKIKDDISNISAFTFRINGWVGINEKKHKNGIITNFNFIRKLDKYNLYLNNLKKY